MHPYPVHYRVTASGAFSRIQLAIRFVAFIALGMLGLSFGALFCFAYLVLPSYAGSWIASQHDGPARYGAEAGPRISRALRWFAAVSAWVGLVADHLPATSPDETIELEIDHYAEPTAGTALARVITGIPSALALAFMCWIGVFVWLWAALSILFTERVGAGAFRYLTGLQRWSVRLLAYQAALVDEYPPFSFEDGASTQLPAAHSL